MYEIRHRIGVEASLGAVYENLATTDGLRHLLSLKHGLESGAARPFPNDVKMSRFD